MVKEENYQAFCEGVGMTKHQQYFLSNYASKIHLAIENSKKEEFSHKEVYHTLKQLKHYYANSWNKPNYSEDDLKEDLADKESKLRTLM